MEITGETENCDLRMKKVGFIGAGQMAQALGKGFLSNGILSSKQLVVSAPSDKNLVTWRELGVSTTNSNVEVLGCDIIFLAVKPHVFSTVICEILDSPAAHVVLCTERKLFVSVITGLTLDTLSKEFSKLISSPSVIRVMPNTPCLVNAGCSVFSLGQYATREDGKMLQRFLSCVGVTAEVVEYQIDAFCGLIGSGPAYIFTVIEALSDGGVMMGIPRDLSTKFSAQMVYGASKMVLQTKEHPGKLKDAVCSPGGTTIQGIHILEKAAFRSALMGAVEASANHAKKLGQK